MTYPQQTLPSPQSDFGTKLNALSTVHPWLQPTTAVALAQGSPTPVAAVQTANVFQQTLLSSWDGFDQWFHDPLLEKQDSASLFLNRWINSTLGPWPIAQPDLTNTQGQLQKDGYGAGLPTDGVWTPEWNAAFNRAANDHYQSQLRGNKPGSVSVDKALGAFVKHAFGAGVVDSLVGFVKSIPGDVRQVVSDVGGQVAADVTGNPLDRSGVSRRADTYTARIQGALGDQQTPQQIHQQVYTRAVNDLGTLVSLFGAGKLAKGVADASGSLLGRTGGNLVGDLGAQEAARGPGVIARTLGAQRSFDTGRIYDNIPILRATGPWVGKLADSDGYYYRLRTFLAQPYRRPIVQIGGLVTGRASLASLGATGAAEATAALPGGQSQPLTDVLRTQTPIDTLDDQLRARSHGVLSLDDANVLLHGPFTGPQALSNVVGHGMETALGAGNRLLGDVHVIGAVERATGLSYPDILKAWGGPDRFNTWSRYKVAQFAAYRYADQTAQKLVTEGAPASRIAALRNQAGVGIDRELLNHGYQMTADDIRTHGQPLDFNTRDYWRVEQALAHEAWQSPDILNAHVQAVAADPHYLTLQLIKEIGTSQAEIKSYLANNVSTYLDAAEHYSNNVLAPYAHQLITPDTFAAQKVAEAQNAVQDVGGARPGSIDWLLANNTNPSGSFGLARLDTKTAQSALADARDFQRRLAAIPPEDFAAQQQLAVEAGDYLERELGLDGQQLAALNVHTPEKLLDALAEHASLLASDVYLPHEASPGLVDAVGKLRDMGYKPVYGQDIGHLFDGTYPLDTPVTGQLSRLRKAASVLGVNLERFAPDDISTLRYAGARSAGQPVIDDPAFKNIPTFVSANDYIRFAEDSLRAGGLPWRYRVAIAASPFNMVTARRIAKVQGISVNEAYRRLGDEALSTITFGDLPRARVVKAWTAPKDLPWLADVAARGGDLEGPVAGLSTHDANRLWLALQKGFTTPAYMTGLESINALARLPLTVAGKPFGLPASNLATRLASLNTALLGARNQFRFALSPYFSFRRVAKTAVKLAVDGVQPTFDPTGVLLREGSYTEAHNLLDRLYPGRAERNPYLEESLRALRQADLFGIYNPREYEAYAALRYQQQGLSEDAIKAKLTKVFTYGSSTEEGRTALERSTNFIFFPFSFEKTLYRNIGGFLLDHPGQALLLTQILDAYRFLNANQQVSDWTQAHLPVLQEFQHLNAFAYGISPGELGGINAPLLNLLLPQQWEANNATKHNLARLAPVLSDFSRVAGEAAQQAKVVEQSLANGYAIAFPHLPGVAKALLPDAAKASAFNPRPAAETSQAQFDDAVAWRIKLIGTFAKVIDYNYSQGSDATKVSWPVSSDVPADLRGRPINRTTIGLLVAHRYPAYKPLDATFFAIKRQENIDSYVASKQGTPFGTDLKSWVQAGRTAIGYISRDAYAPAQQGDVQAVLRQRALTWASTVPGFLRWYNANFRRDLGPIETVRT